jgi:hypothetical protein
MFIEDYILRQIAQLVAVIMKIAGLKKAGEYQEAYKTIDQTIEEMFGLDANIVKQLDDNSLFGLLATANGIDLGKLYALADILKTEGDVLAAQRCEKESRQSYQRALDLFLELSARSTAELETEVLPKINELQKRLAT